jgi:hypothetical protein
MDQSGKYDPEAVDAVVEAIIADLPLEARVRIADLDEDEFRVLELTLAKYIWHKLRQCDVQANKELMEACISKSGEPLDESSAAAAILKEVWNRLHNTHRLRVVK